MKASSAVALIIIVGFLSALTTFLYTKSMVESQLSDAIVQSQSEIEHLKSALNQTKLVVRNLESTLNQTKAKVIECTDCHVEANDLHAEMGMLCTACHGVSSHLIHRDRVDCETCHGSAADVKIPKAEPGHSVCENCHNSNVIKIHVEEAGITCERCHGTITEIHARIIPSPSQTSTPTSTTAPSIPEDHKERTTCRSCHEKGVGGSPQFPSTPDHSGFTDDVNVCLSCHEYES